MRVETSWRPRHVQRPDAAVLGTMRADRRWLRLFSAPLDSRAFPGQRPDAIHRRGHPAGRRRVPRAAVPNHCRRWRDPFRDPCVDSSAWNGDRMGVRTRSDSFRSVWIHRNECFRAGQCTHCSGCHTGYTRGSERRVSGRRHHRDARRWTGSLRRQRGVLGPHTRPRDW